MCVGSWSFGRKDPRPHPPKNKPSHSHKDAKQKAAETDPSTTGSSDSESHLCTEKQTHRVPKKKAKHSRKESPGSIAEFVDVETDEEPEVVSEHEHAMTESVVDERQGDLTDDVVYSCDLNHTSCIS